MQHIGALYTSIQYAMQHIGALYTSIQYAMQHIGALYTSIQYAMQHIGALYTSIQYLERCTQSWVDVLTFPVLFFLARCNSFSSNSTSFSKTLISFLMFALKEKGTQSNGECWSSVVQYLHTPIDQSWDLDLSLMDAYTYEGKSMPKSCVNTVFCNATDCDIVTK